MSENFEMASTIKTSEMFKGSCKKQGWWTFIFKQVSVQQIIEQ